MDIKDLYYLSESQYILDNGAKPVLKEYFSKHLSEDEQKQFENLLNIAQKKAFEIGYKTALALNISESMR
ncbi:MAG: hypothetical protein E7635_06730 [Ruminococcaceae bacterium]|nr:hypothetical protein [Oscillospiraceae bacterium]